MEGNWNAIEHMWSNSIVVSCLTGMQMKNKDA